MKKYKIYSINRVTSSHKAARNCSNVLRFTFLALLVLMSLFFVGCGQEGQTALSESIPTQDVQQAIPVQAAAAPAAQQMAMSDYSSDITEGFAIESVIEESEKTIIAAHYPITEREAVDAMIRGDSEKAVNEFLKKVEELPSDGNMYELNRNFESFVWDFVDENGEVLENQDEIVSFLFRSTSELNQTVPQIGLDSHVFNLNTQKEIALEDLFSPDFVSSGGLYQTLSTICKAQLLDNESKGLAWNQAQLDQGLASTKENFSHYVLDGSELVLIFDVYQLGPWSQGTPMLRFALADFRENLSKEGLLLLTGKEASENENAQKDETPNPSPIPEISAVSPTPSLLNTPAPLTEDGKYIALTFDDGPHKTLTPRVLDMLAKYNAKATFFVLGNRLTYAKDILQRMNNEGHQIGNHSYSHKKLSSISQSEMEEEVYKTDEILQSIIGQKTTALRPPYGSMSEALQAYCAEKGVPIILWNIDPEDWKNKDAQIIADHIIENAKEGSIILLHDIHEQSVDAAEIVLKKLTEKGYTFVTISQLFPNAIAGKSHREK